MKTYNSPMLTLVGFDKKDIIVTSPKLHEDVAGTKGGDASGFGFAPDRFGGDEGY